MVGIVRTWARAVAMILMTGMLAFVTQSPARAEDPPPDGPKMAAAELAPVTLSGTVTDQFGNPVTDESGYVELYQWSDEFASFEYHDAAVPDADGAYSFSVQPGRYAPVAYPFGSGQLPGYAHGATEMPTAVDSPGVVEVLADTPAAVPLQFRQDPDFITGGVRGTVTDQADRPLSEVDVTVVSADGDQLGQGYTDSLGQFSINGIRVGDVEVRVDAREDFLGRGVMATVTQDQVTDLGAIKLSPTPRGTLTGRVLSSSGAPVAQAHGELRRVYTYEDGSRGSSWVADFETDDNGAYSTDGLRLNGSSYSVRVYDTGADITTWLGNTEDVATATLITPTEASNVAADLTMLRGASVSGTVSGPSGPAADVRVEAMRWDADYGWQTWRSGYTDEAGAYSIRLTSGTYTLRFDGQHSQDGLADAWLEGEAEPASATAPGTFTLATGESVTKDKTLPLAQRATGRVTTRAGAGLAGATVTPYRWITDTDTTEGGYWTPWGTPTTADDSGAYSVRVPGNSTVTFRFGRGGYQGKFLGGTDTLPAAPTAANSAAIGTADLTPVPDMALEPRVSSLGKVAGQRLDYCLAKTLPANDDDSSDAVALPFELKYFGTPYTELYVNNNGNVTFGSSQSTYTPGDLTGPTERPIIAPFFADVDTSGESNQVTYGTSPDGRTLCVNWADVGYFSNQTDKLNTFQLLLTKNSSSAGRVEGDFDITFNYDQILWETGSASGGTDGFGGTSAAAGFSAGTGAPGTFVQLPGSFTNGALLDGGPNALIAGSQDSSQPGRYVFQVRNDGIASAYGALGGTVTKTNGDPVAGAYVQICDSTDTGCSYTETDAAGHYGFAALRAADYSIRVWPSSDELFGGGATATIVAGETTTVDPIVLTAPKPMPAGTTINGANDGGVPSVYFNDPFELSVSGCAGVTSPTVRVALSDGTVIHASVALTESSAGRYTATVPALHPHTGEAVVTTNVPATCGSDPVKFNLYIDPSGVVTDQYGRPQQGASVTLSRSDTQAGEYTVVPNGSDIMSPSNRANPSTTDNTGYFRWDVRNGWYKVTAAKESCQPGTTPGMEVPPEKIDLLIKLTCDTAAPTPSAQPRVDGVPKVGQTITALDGTWAAPLRAAGVELLRNGEPLPGATHTLTPSDIGAVFTARSRASRPDYVQEHGSGEAVQFTPATATSTPVAGARGDAATATTAPELSGTARVGETLTVTDGSWSRAGVSTSRQWLRNGTAIEGATATSYVLTPADVDAAISVKVTASQDGYEDGTATSGAKTVAKGAQAANTALPAVSGTPANGQTLSATTGTWDRPDQTFTYQWTRNGAAITGATAATYRVGISDVATKLAVVVTASRAGYEDGRATSAFVTVAKVRSTTSNRLPSSTVKSSRRAKVTVKVTATGFRPTGRVRIYDGAKLIASTSLTSANNGLKTVTLPRISKVGRHKIKSVYAGNATISSSTARAVVLRVVR